MEDNIIRAPLTSEEPFMLKALAQKMIEQGNVTPLKDLHRRFISDCENNGYTVTECQDEVTVDFSLRQIDMFIAEGNFVYTTDEFMKLYDEGSISPFDGYGFFYDGIKRIEDIDIWEADYDTYWSFPYVMWINN